MKVLKVLFSGILSILLSYSLCSCGGGEDDDVVSPDTDQSGGTVPTPNIGTKKLAEIVVECADLEDCKTIKFQYDNQGNLSFVSITDNDEISEFTYKYEGDKILVSGVEEKDLNGSDAGDIIQKTYYLLNGKVASITQKREDSYFGDVQTYYNFEYDKTGNHIASVNLSQNKGGSGSIEDIFLWEDGMIKEIRTEIYSSQYTELFQYDPDPIICKGFLPLLSHTETLHDSYLLMAKPELALMTTNKLPNSVKSNFDSSCETYIYELNNEGYVRKQCIQREGISPVFYIFTWK